MHAVYLEWCVLVLVQEHVELADADPEVPVSELVGDVEAKSTKFPSFQRDAVEHTQREEEVLEVLALVDVWEEWVQHRMSGRTMYGK